MLFILTFYCFLISVTMLYINFLLLPDYFSQVICYIFVFLFVFYKGGFYTEKKHFMTFGI